MSSRTSYEIISSYMTEPVRNAMLSVGNIGRNRLCEIRLRSNRPVAYIYPGCVRYLASGGELASDHRSSQCVSVSAENIAAIVNKLCRYSVHSCSRELREGFFVLEGGIRVGVAGTCSETSDKTLRDFNALNFRIARAVIGCAEEIFHRTCSHHASVLICGGVNSGKTTLLRDLCRLCGDRFKVTLIDERNEISSSVAGSPSNDVGVLTDIISGAERSSGIISAIRTLSPDMIFCDEISTPADSEAILSGYGCGVRFAATLHAENFEGMMKRSVAERLISAGVFDYAVFLGGSAQPSTITEVRSLKNAS